MKAQRCSYHVSADREDRMITILTTVGLGEELITVRHIDSTGRPCLRTLTTTGVIICKNCETKIITTAFIATAAQVRKMYGSNHCPDFIYGVIKKNQIRFKDIL